MGRLGKFCCAIAAVNETAASSNATIIALKRLIASRVLPCSRRFKHTTWDQDAVNPADWQGRLLQVELVTATGLRGGIVIVATPMTTQAKPIQAVGDRLSPSSQTPSVTPIGTRR